MGVEIDLIEVMQSASIIMNHLKSVEQVNKDLLEGRCVANVLPFSFIFFKDNQNIKWDEEQINFVTYFDGRTFYRKGNEYQTLNLMQEWQKMLNSYNP